MVKQYVCKLAPTAIILGAVFFTSAAHAIPVLETRDNVAGLAAATQTIYGAERDLIFESNVAGNANGVGRVAQVNGLVLFGDATSVDALAKVDDVNSNNNAVNQALTDFDSLPGVTFNSGALSVTCTSDKCASFDWVFDQSNVDNLDGDWNIVKIGVKYGGGEGPAFFLIDPIGVGADSGSFDLGDYIDLDNPDDSNPLSQFFNLRSPQTPLNGLSHVDFFGTNRGTTDVAEPGTLALLGLGLVGLGFARRKKKPA